MITCDGAIQHQLYQSIYMLTVNYIYLLTQQHIIVRSLIDLYGLFATYFV